MSLPTTVQILVLQSTAFCNIDCSYCYLPNRGVTGRMSEAVLERVSEQIISSERWAADSLVLWHAGEPFSNGPAWYYSAHQILGRRAKQPLRIQFQTNGTLMDQRWIELLKSSGAWIGLSVDGPQELHDTYRKDKRGRPTYERVMDAVRLLRQGGVPFTTIAVVTQKSLDYADEIFSFFAELRPARVAFSVEEAEGSNELSSLYQPMLLNRVERFFERIATLNFQHPVPLRIREVEDVLVGLVAPANRTGVSQETELGWIIAVGTAGDVAFFSPELLTTRQADGHYASVGNILTHNLDEIMAGAAVQRQADAIRAGVQRCREACSYFNHCGGGSPANKYFETRRFDVTETWYCRVAKQAVVRGILKAICAAHEPKTRARA